MNKCYGEYNSTTRKGWGGAYKNACVHSGIIRISGDLPTIWYNYVLASANTLIDGDTTPENPAPNTTKATESICPKGWTLPNYVQVGSNRNPTNFFPVLGGYYGNGSLGSESTHGLWWGSEANDGGNRYNLVYNNSLYTGSNSRYNGFYIRCVPAPWG